MRRTPKRLSIRTPEDFIAVVPYLLGFHPSDSLVALFFDGGRVGLTARVDLPSPEAIDDLVQDISALGRQSRAGSVVLLAYGADHAGRAVLERFMTDSPLQLLDVLVVGPERWWSLACPGACCPPEGTPYDISAHPLCAEAVLAGMSAAADRSALQAMVTGPPPPELDSLADLAAEAVAELVGVDRRLRKRRMATLLRTALPCPDVLTDRDCAELAALCLDLPVRDAAWASMSRREADQHLALWRRVLSRTIDELSPGPLGLVAMAGWLSGNGALLNCCIDRLERLAPEYTLLQVCRDISWRAVPPVALGRAVGSDPRRPGAPVRLPWPLG